MSWLFLRYVIEVLQWYFYLVFINHKEAIDNMTSTETASKIEKDNGDDNNSNSAHSRDPLTDIDYICKSTTLITESLRNGKDIAQLPNGDIIITERKIVHLHYTWDPVKAKMVRIS